MVVSRYDSERREQMTIAHPMDMEAVTRFMVGHLAVCDNPEPLIEQIDEKNAQPAPIA